MKNILYNLIIEDATEHCYENCLNYFPDRSDVLDVGIGNGTMLKQFHSLIKNKNLKITGIDINRVYIDHCDQLIRSYGLEDHIDISYAPVESYEPPENTSFDFILFSMSFMLFSDRQLVLDRIKRYMKPGGKIMFFQTMFRERFPLMEYIKPKLKYITTIDFGPVTYEQDFLDLLHKNSMSVAHDRLIKKEWFGGEYRMIVASVEENDMGNAQ